MLILEAPIQLRTPGSDPILVKAIAQTLSKQIVGESAYAEAINFLEAGRAMSIYPNIVRRMMTQLAGQCKSYVIKTNTFYI